MVAEHAQHPSDDSAIDVVRPAGELHRLNGPRLGLPTLQELETLLRYGQIIVASGLAPKHISTPEAALVTIRQAHQLGVDEFTGLQNSFVIDGKVTISASLMHSLILRDHGPDSIHVIESTATRCELRCTRRGARFSTTVEYAIEEAKAAGLATKPVWQKYPKDLLFARAISRAGRQVFRDSTMGLYTPEELDGSVIDVEGEVIDITEQQRSAHIRELRNQHEAEKDTAAAADGSKATRAQLEQIANLGHNLGLSQDEIRTRAGKAGKNMTANEAASLIGELAAEIKANAAMADPRDGDAAIERMREIIDVPVGVAGDDRYTS